MAIVDDITKTLEKFYKTCMYEIFAFKYQDYMSNKILNDDINSGVFKRIFK